MIKWLPKEWNLEPSGITIMEYLAEFFPQVTNLMYAMLFQIMPFWMYSCDLRTLPICIYTDTQA